MNVSKSITNIISISMLMATLFAFVSVSYAQEDGTAEVQDEASVTATPIKVDNMQKRRLYNMRLNAEKKKVRLHRIDAKQRAD
jgi:hypothetical protein